MSDDASGLELLKKAKENRTAGDGDDEGTGEPKNLSSDTESSADDPKNISSNEEEGKNEPDGTTAPDDDSAESSPQNRSSSTETSSRSSGRRASSRSRRGEGRSGSSSSRKEKAFMFDPEEERRFNHLLADVRSLVRREHPEVSVQNSQLVRAMVEMTIEDLEEGEDLILDYVLDQIEQDR